MGSMNLATAVDAAQYVGPGANTVRSVLFAGAQLLKAAGIESARIDAEALLSYCLNFDKARLYLNLDTEMSPQARLRFGEFLTRRLKREPVAYITGSQEFWSLDFRVTPDVLIPRPDTERLVEIAVELARDCAGDLRILDLGTGSGAIAVSLAKELPEGRVWAIDRSLPALEVARDNAARHGVVDRIQFAGSNLFDSIGATREFHMIVSNPPYVRQGEFPALAPEVSQWEPRIALDGGFDGLDYYRQIINRGHRHLVLGGMLVLEIGADMGFEVAHLLENSGHYMPPKVFRDYGGKDRVVVARAMAAGGNA
jgi:release factor glutamine methyltransferase